MVEDHARPNPDELLEQVQAEERQRKRGRLVIFLGYAAGVGKTYAMLEAARDLRQQGRDVVIGYVETHGRPETDALLPGLEFVPPRFVEYRDVKLREMDVDAVLARRPTIALVDELAHTNSPGSRHPKRYQDVEELLDAGIDVYTTLNVQHLESLNDVVAQITGVQVRETVPDSVIDEAAEIILVDLPPDDLLQRLREGKVYVPDQAARAIERFFRKGNLTALRELGLRRAAERVDTQMRAYMQTRAIPGPWAAAERLLVCVSPSPLGERLVRSARRLAAELSAEWFAIYVETPELSQASPDKKERVARTLQLAEQLGAKTVIVPGNNVVETVVDYARRHNITKIIAGKPLRSRWDEWLHGAVVDNLIRRSGDIDVYVVSGEAARSDRLAALAVGPERPWQRYATALALVTAASLLCGLLSPLVSPINLVMIYLLTVVVAAYWLGRGPSILASIVSVLVFDFFFVPPHLTFAVSDAQYVLTFFGYVVVGLMISQLTSQARSQAEGARRREIETTTLYALSRDVAVAVGLDAVVGAIITNVGEALGRKVRVFLPSPDTGEVLRAYPRSVEPVDPNEQAVAVWAFQHGQPAGRGSDTLPAAAARYLPLRTVRGTVGVLAVEPPDPAAHLTPDERRLLEGLTNLSALAIERASLVEQASQAQLLQVTEKLQQALLDSVAHDLRTPLVTITGALSTLVDDADRLDKETRRTLSETARDEADRLNRLVGNLLEMARINAGALRTTLEPGDFEDAIGTALEQIGPRLERRQVEINVPPDLPLAPMDFVLIVHVLVNLIENAMKYSPPEAPIDISAQQAKGEVVVEVADRGIGIPTEDLNRIFEKFYRVRQPENVNGTGLGLSISKSIIEAHGGRIWARAREGGGAVIAFALPLVQTGSRTVVPGEQHA